MKDEVYRDRLNTKLPAASRLADPLARPKAAQYSVIHAIATNKMKLPLKTGVHSPIIKRQIFAAPPTSVVRTASG